MQNRYPWWKNLLLVVLFAWGVLYAIPSMFGDDPAVQIYPQSNAALSSQVVSNVKNALQANHLKYLAVTRGQGNILVRFSSTNVQLKAREDIKSALGDNYTVALNLASRTPSWLKAIGAESIKLGLDLRGGVHLVLEVDVDTLIKRHEEGDIRTIGSALREANIRYSGITQHRPNGITVHFRDQKSMEDAYSKLGSRLQEYNLVQLTTNGRYRITAIMSQAALTKIINYAIDQTMNIINNRVNALGVSEAEVQRQGLNHISVELPGVQDTARAKNLIGKVATLRFQMVDHDHDVQSAVAGNVPIGSTLYMTSKGQPVLLHNKVILRGNSVNYATASFGRSGRPSVNVRLGSGDITAFNRVTAENIGKSMAVVYVRTRSKQQKIAGKLITVHHKTEKVISVATIQSALGSNFEITGLQSAKYAQNLALLLRSGALVAPIVIVQERTVGPSMGVANIHMGLISIAVGFFAVVLFMAFYYGLFGIIADMALLLNLIFIVAIFAVLGVTLTLPGIAAMVLTVGMAVDANVLINERIREELRNGVSPQASIHIGYERAFVTIVDSNVTTLIVALVLFALGSGSVKGFAMTLIVGLLASMVTSIMFTRSIVNWIYGGKSVKRLSIGIKVK